MQELYLDANAHVSLSQAARNVYNKSLELGHPSSLNAIGRKSAALLEESRAKIAELIGAKTPNQIYFTSGCTQAAEWGISIVLKHFEKTDWNFCPTNILYSPIEHVAVRNVIEDIDFNHKQQGRDVCKVDSDGKLDIEYKHPNGEIFKFIDKNDCLICIHSHNEFGTIQDFSNIERKFLFSDLSQTLGKEKLNVTDLNVDLGIFGAHKFGGPTGVGFMYLKNPDIWEPFGTGGRYFLDRTGTPDVLGILAIVGIIFVLLSPLFAQLIHFAISRKREYLADASGALLTRYPEGLASALEKIAGASAPLRHQSKAIAHLYLADPRGLSSKIATLFQTHPPIKDRIKALLGGK
jgi:cysteine sulfinate desulfinase/cysteine desulfurase-like protein